MAALHFDNKAALIQEVKYHPVIWKGKHEKYGDIFCTAAAWKSIARKLGTSENILREKWKNLYNTFRNILKKSGLSCREEYNGKWQYFHLMTFIKDENQDDEGSIEFIVLTDSGDEISDNESRISYSAQSNNYHESELRTQNNTIDEDSSKSNCDDRLKYDKNETRSINDEEIIRYIDKRQYDDRTFNGKPEDITDDDDVPSKRQKTSNRHANYDVMFLRSLAPYFKQLDPLRKLVMRSKIQDLLLNEIAEQKSVEYDS